MSRHEMPFGAALQDGGGTLFRLWAPGVPAVNLEAVLGDERRQLPMQAEAGGWYSLRVPEAGVGTRYRFQLPGGEDGQEGLYVPDPASRFNPHDVHSVSEVTDPHAYAWQDGDWRGRPWHEAVVYELHVGTFTPEGSFAAAAKRLPELAALGITAVELMPVADFPGQRGWGYDGVLHYAPDAAYGQPDALKAFVDDAHRLGLMVLLDVVYNHFGPEGNYLHAYCPAFFNAAHQTPWGAAINFDGEHREHVRAFFRHNALYWVEEFHFDGLRLDAVHAMHDDTTCHIACEIGQALRDGPGRHRRVHLVLENDTNEAHKLERDAEGRPTCADAQWNDDFHHAAHVVLSGETDGYYADFDGSGELAPLARLGRAFAQGYVYQGEHSAHRDAPQGEPSSHLPCISFVSFVQNHDQIGNRALGDRLSATADPARLDAMYAALLLSPHIPMLFMGEEYAASTPFLYFCDFGPELAEAVSNGRRSEFARFAAFRDEQARARIPDPNEVATFEASRLRWEEREAPGHRERLDLIRRLLRLRHEHLVPRLPDVRGGGSYQLAGGLLRVIWPLVAGGSWQLGINLSDTVVHGVMPRGRMIFDAGGAAEGRWPPNAVQVMWVERPTTETTNREPAEQGRP